MQAIGLSREYRNTINRLATTLLQLAVDNPQPGSNPDSTKESLMSSAPHTIDISPYGSVIDAKYRRCAPRPVQAAATHTAIPTRRLSISRLRSELLMFGYLYRSELLLLAYIGTVLASPLGDVHRLIGEGLALLTLMILLAGSTYMLSRRIERTIVYPLAAIWLLARSFIAFGFTHAVVAGLAPMAGLVLSVVVLTAILRRLASPPMVTTGVIAEAFMGYLALATAFGEVFWMLNHLIGTPFNQSIPGSQTSTMLYFSMITLTSVGYGGIVPINPFLRLVAALESMLGVFYVAVVVARLASFYRSGKGARA
jgi:hypothetical protein